MIPQWWSALFLVIMVACSHQSSTRSVVVAVAAAEVGRETIRIAAQNPIFFDGEGNRVT